MTIHIGYAQEAITPDLSRPVFLAGFGRNRRAVDVHDDLFARALAIQSVDRRIVLVALDLIGLERGHCMAIADSIRQEAGPVDVVISSTHTHHGPDTIGLWGPDMVTSGFDPQYLDLLRARVQGAAVQALGRLAPAGMRAAAVQVTGVAKNARDPHILEDELVMLQFTTPDGRPMVTLSNFSCHPETLWMENPIITADYPHFLRAWIERETGAPVIFFAGSVGGMMTPDVTEHTFAEAQRIGETLARSGLAALDSCKAESVEGFDYRKLAYQVPLKSPLFEMAMKAHLVQRSFQRRRPVQTEAGLLRVGPAGFIYVPGELLPKLGLQVKSQLHAAGSPIAGVIGLSNDELGYILPDGDYRYPLNPFEPGDHYEETMSVGPKAGSLLLAAVRQLLG